MPPLSALQFHDRYLLGEPRVKAVVVAGYGGQQAGAGLAAVLFGDHAPAARLPTTWYRQNWTSYAAPESMDMAKWPGRTYKFVDKAFVLLPFGFALHYTTFEYSGLTVVRGEDPTSKGTIAVTVRNAGAVASGTAVLAFLARPGASPAANGEPTRELAGFAKLAVLAPGESAAVRIALPRTAFTVVRGDGRREAAAGAWEVRVEALRHEVAVDGDGNLM